MSRGGAASRRVAAWLAVLVVVAAMAVVVGGCSSDSASTSSTPASPTSATTGPSTSQTADTGPSDTGTAPPTTQTETGGTSTTGGGGLGPGSGVETEAKRLSPDSGPFVICQDCHTYLDPPARARPALNGTFAHERHLARSAGCPDCHESPVHTETVVRRPTMSACYSCHGDGPTSIAPAECDLCHPPDFKQLPESHDDAFYKGAHAAAAAAAGVEECFVCHQGGDTGFCRACHGLDMPHPPGWALDLEGGPGAHVDAAHRDAAICVRCHENRGRAPAGCYGGECHGV